MREYGLKGLLNLAVTPGATTPAPPANTPAVIWSTTVGQVLVWIGASWQPLDGEVNLQTGTSYTVAATDYGGDIVLTNASAIALTYPNSLWSGFKTNIWQGGAGQITTSLGSGLSYLSQSTAPKSSGVGSLLYLRQLSSTLVGVAGGVL